MDDGGMYSEIEDLVGLSESSVSVGTGVLVTFSESSVLVVSVSTASALLVVLVTSPAPLVGAADASGPEEPDGPPVTESVALGESPLDDELPVSVAVALPVDVISAGILIVNPSDDVGSVPEPDEDPVGVSVLWDFEGSRGRSSETEGKGSKGSSSEGEGEGFSTSPSLMLLVTEGVLADEGVLGVGGGLYFEEVCCCDDVVLVGINGGSVGRLMCMPSSLELEDELSLELVFVETSPEEESVGHGHGSRVVVGNSGGKCDVIGSNGFQWLLEVLVTDELSSDGELDGSKGDRVGITLEPSPSVGEALEDSALSEGFSKIVRSGSKKPRRLDELDEESVDSELKGDELLAPAELVIDSEGTAELASSSLPRKPSSSGLKGLFLPFPPCGVDFGGKADSSLELAEETLDSVEEEEDWSADEDSLEGTWAVSDVPALVSDSVSLEVSVSEEDSAGVRWLESVVEVLSGGGGETPVPLNSALGSTTSLLNLGVCWTTEAVVVPVPVTVTKEPSP